MRKICFLMACLISLQQIAFGKSPDTGNFTFSVDAPTFTVSFTNISTLGNEPGDRKAFWNFGDGKRETTGALHNIQHHYSEQNLKHCHYITIIKNLPVSAGHLVMGTMPALIIQKHIPEVTPLVIPMQLPGEYKVCEKIIYFGGCEKSVCKEFRVPDKYEPHLILTPDPVHNEVHALYYSTFSGPVTTRIMNANIQVRSYTRTAVAGINNWEFGLGILSPGIYTFVVQSPNQAVRVIFLKI